MIFGDRRRTRIFYLLSLAMLLATLVYMPWVVLVTEMHWLHLYWFALGAYLHIAVFRVDRLLRKAGSEAIKQGSEQW